MPVYSYNGGYYSINPNVLDDFYQANGFDDMRTYIVMWDRYRAYTGQNLCYEYSPEVLGARHSLADYDQCRYSPHMLFFARKDEEVSDIIIPQQFSGEYLAALSEKRRVADGWARYVDMVKRVLNILYRLLPYPTVYYLHALARRNLDLMESKRVSFWI